MSTHTPSPQHDPRDDAPVDFVMDDLVRQTLELESFERDIAAPAPLRIEAPVVHARTSRRALGLWLGSGLAAAAAVTAAVILLPANTAHVPARGSGTVAHATAPHELGGRDASSHAPETTVAAQDTPALVRTVAQPVRDDDLQQFAYLDPDIATGLPSLASERSVVLAVYQGDVPQNCDCVAWSVEQPGDWETAKGNVLEEALRQPCMRDASALTLVKITGPRVLLPFHDDDARELARCVPSSNCDEACAFQAASECVPSTLRVQTRTIEWAAR